MKPVLTIKTDGISSDNIFTAKEIKLRHFSGEFHFHEECQLVYVLKSNGKRIIGDLVDNYESGELIFLGSNIPHVWHSTIDPENADIEDDVHAHSLSLFFNPEKLICHLAPFGKTSRLESFLKTSQRGIEFAGHSKQLILDQLLLILKQEGLQKIITLLNILDIMMAAEEYDYLASINYINHYQYQDSKRMDQVFKFIFNNFREDISLETISGIAAMNPHAFCRFFKSRTQKSFTEFVNEIRISFACKLLKDTDNSITDIAYECGFNNVSNFNRFFKKINKKSPREYRRLIN